MRYIPGNTTQQQIINAIYDAEMKLTERYDRDGAITDAAEQKKWCELIRDASFGRNTVIFDDQGNPSVMVVFPLQKQVDLIPGGTQTAHYAFIVNNSIKPRLYIAKYQCFTVGSGTTLRAVSLKGKDPAVNIIFDNAILACTQKGTGWHLMTNAEWAAIALWTKKQGFMPRGNNNFGTDINVSTETGIMSYYDSGSGKVGRVTTGSGPISWSHDGSPFGIFDLNGNVWEWVGGLRLKDGEIQVIKDNDAAINTADQSATSSLWQAILQDGTLVAPGTANTLKYDNTTAGDSTTTSHDVGGDIRVNTTVANPNYIPGGQVDYGYSNTAFESITAAAGVTIPVLLQALGLYPIDASHGVDGVWSRNYGERLSFRGGNWSVGAGAGVFSLNLSNPRSYANTSIGFRSAFVL